MSVEIAIAGAFLDLNGDVPPNLQRLLDNPEALPDLRCSQMVRAIRDLRKSGKAIHAQSVNDLLQFDDSLTFIIQATNAALPISTAELEAETVWVNFQSRRTASLFSEAADAITTHPEQAASIREHVISEIQMLSSDADSLQERLAQRIYDAAKPPSEPTIVFSIGKIPIATAGNILTISAEAKGGKSAVIGAMLSAPFASEGSDCFGIKASNPNGLAVIHFDTEQSPYDSFELITRSVKRAGVQAAPEWLLSYCLTGFSAVDIRRAIRPLLQSAKERFKGVLALIIDGVADAALDVNDPAEANSFVAELHALAIEFQCAIVAVIHLNPGSDFKTRGHLGSQLERKAETNLKLEKDTDETITLFAVKNRRAPIPKAAGPRFAWNNEAGMHVSVESRQQSKDDVELEEVEDLFIKAFTNRPAMHFSDLKTTVKQLVTVGDRTAERKIAKAVTLQIIRKTFAGLYELRT